MRFAVQLNLDFLRPSSIIRSIHVTQMASKIIYNITLTLMLWLGLVSSYRTSKIALLRSGLRLHTTIARPHNEATPTRSLMMNIDPLQILPLSLRAVPSLRNLEEITRSALRSDNLAVDIKGAGGYPTKEIKDSIYLNIWQYLNSAHHVHV